MSKKKINNNKELSARLMAVQAYYQNSQNNKPVSVVIKEYLEHGIETQDDEEMPKPHGALFKRILLSLDNRLSDINDMVMANINKAEVPIAIVDSDKEDNDNEEKDLPKPPEKELEPLLKAILLCGAGELLSHQDIDAPLIINDYLDVTHAFYEASQVSFVNGILDKIASIIRA